MNAIVVFALLFAALFVLAFVTKRRFGVLGLALCAGSLLSSTWASSLTPLIQQQGITLLSPPLSSVVAISLTLLPALLLMFGGPTYNTKFSRFLGSLLFVLLAFVFFSESLASALIFDTWSQNIYNTLQAMSNIIIIAGVTAAVVDLLLTRSPKGKHRSEH